MKIELREIHRYSESSGNDAFAAQLYINGQRAAFVIHNKDNPKTRYQPYNTRDEHLVRSAEAFCKALPPAKPDTETTGETSKPMDLRRFIDELYLKHVRSVALEKAMELGIVFGEPDGPFRVQGFKMPFEMLLVHPVAPEVIEQVIRQKIAPELNDGRLILNTNIPEEILKASGLKPVQYLQQKREPQQVKKQAKRPGRKL